MDVKPSGRFLATPTAQSAPGHAPWPERTRRLLGQLRELAHDWLHAPLQQALEVFASQLFQQAESDHRGNSMQECMHSREQVLKRRQDIEARFLEALDAALGAIGAPHQPDPALNEDQPLGLVATSEQEMESTLAQIAARAEARGSTHLTELGYRLAVLIAAPPLSTQEQPLAPRVLTRAFRTATQALDLPNAHHLGLLEAFDKTVMGSIGTLYGELNRHLARDGLLPHLRAYNHIPAAPRPPATAATWDDAETAGAAADLSDPIHASPSGASAPIAVLDNLRELLAQSRERAGMAAASGGRVASADELQSALGALQQHVNQVTEQAGRELRSAEALRQELLLQLNRERAPGAPPARLSQADDDVVELIARLFEQLGQQTQADGSAHTMLGGLQLPVLRAAVSDRRFFERRQHPARRLLDTVVEAAHDWLDRSDGRPDPGLKRRLEALVQRANNEPPSTGLYTSLLADIEQSLTELKLRARVAERRQVEAMQAREHLDQARARAAVLMGERTAKAKPGGLLKVLLERAWTDVLTLLLVRHGEDHPASRACLHTTDQLLGLAPVDSHQRLQADVEHGLARIGMAPLEATQVAQRLLGKALPRTDPHGAPSNTELMVRLKQHQRLGAHTEAKPAPVGAPPDAAPRTSATHRRPAPGTGTTTPPTTATPAPVSAPATAPAAPSPTKPASAPAAPSGRADAPSPPPAAATTVPATPAPTPTATPALAPGPARDPRERSVANRLRLLPFGTWFEFTDPDSGRRSQRKLAWFSPMSGRALFVTRRGQRAAEINLSTLAHDLVQGRVRELSARREHLFDRAWRNLAHNLGAKPGPTDGKETASHA